MWPECKKCVSVPILWNIALYNCLVQECKIFLFWYLNPPQIRSFCYPWKFHLFPNVVGADKASKVLLSEIYFSLKCRVMDSRTMLFADRFAPVSLLPPLTSAQFMTQSLDRYTHVLSAPQAETFLLLLYRFKDLSSTCSQYSFNRPYLHGWQVHTVYLMYISAPSLCMLTKWMTECMSVNTAYI